MRRACAGVIFPKDTEALYPIHECKVPAGQPRRRLSARGLQRS
jgi:hypothetical protein